MLKSSLRKAFRSDLAKIEPGVRFRDPCGLGFWASGAGARGLEAGLRGFGSGLQLSGLGFDVCGLGLEDWTLKTIVLS